MSDEQPPSSVPETADSASPKQRPRHLAPDESPTESPDESVATALPTTFGPKAGYERSREESRRDRFGAIRNSRILLLVIGAFLIQAAFISSYVGAFHEQKPHAMTVSVISDHNWQSYVANQLNDIKGQPVWAYPETDPDVARTMLKEQRRQAVYIFDPRSKNDQLLIASSTGSSNAAAVELIFQQVAAKQGRTLTVNDVAPVQSGDSRGLTGFYLVVGWLVGGYLMAALVGLQLGPKAKNFRRMALRLLLCLVYAPLSGLAGALIVDTWLESLTGHFWTLVGIGTLLSLAASIFTLGLEAVFGTVGVGIAILIFVVLGNPAAGGAYNYQLLPEPWRFIGQWLPNGAGVDAVRSVVYLDSYNLGFHLWVLAWWVAVGLLVFLLAANNTYWGFKRPALEREPEQAAA